MTKAAPKHTIGLSLKGQSIVISVLNDKRLTQYGFGLFLENVKPKEVTATKDAIKALCEQPQRGGLCALEFWPDNRLAFCVLRVPLDNISVPTGAKKWIKQFTTSK